MIRPARPADWLSVLAINAAGAPGVSPLDLSELARLAAEAAYFRVAEDRGAVAGYLLAFAMDAAYDAEEFLWFRRHAPGSLYVDQVAVAPAARRRGIASDLYRDAAAFAAARGLHGLACEVNLHPPNPPSLRFHARLGFEPAATMETADGRTVSLLLLDLGLAAPDAAAPDRHPSP